MVTFRRISPEEWSELPAPTTKKAPDKYDELLGAVEAGEMVELETEGEKDLRGKRIGIGRGAKGRGFKVEYRIQGNKLYVKRGADIDSKSSAAASATGGKRRGRPRKQPAEPQPEGQESE